MADVRNPVADPLRFEHRALRLERSGGSLQVTGFGRDHALPPIDEEALMNVELSILGADPGVERVLGD